MVFPTYRGLLWEREGKGKEECWVLFVFLKMTFLKLIKIRENQRDCKINSLPAPENTHSIAATFVSESKTYQVIVGFTVRFP